MKRAAITAGRALRWLVAAWFAIPLLGGAFGIVGPAVTAIFLGLLLIAWGLQPIKPPVEPEEPR